MSATERERDEKGVLLKRHGMKHTKLYGVWCGMKRRCYCTGSPDYTRYGGRGIKVCDEWKHDFMAFHEWATANGYAPGLSIDRIDCDGDYRPENCRWVTQAVQNRNYSRNHFITYRGETKCLSDWADEYGIKRATILWRLKNGKPMDEVFRNVDGRSLRWKNRTHLTCSTQ